MIRSASRGFATAGLLSLLLAAVAAAQQPPLEVVPQQPAAGDQAQPEAPQTPAETPADEPPAADDPAEAPADEATADDGDDGEHAKGEADGDHGNDDGEHAKGEAGGDHGEHPPGEHDDGEHAGENPLDLSHSNATPGQEQILEWKFDLAFFTLVVFLLLLAILLKFAWGPIMGALQKRESRIASLIEEAEQSADKARRQLEAYEQKLAAAQQEAEAIVDRAAEAAAQQADEIVAEAKAASQREKQQAIAEIEVAKNEALGEVTQRSVDIALTLAQNIVSRELRAEDHDALIKSALEQFPS